MAVEHLEALNNCILGAKPPKGSQKWNPFKGVYRGYVGLYRGYIGVHRVYVLGLRIPKKEAPKMTPITTLEKLGDNGEVPFFARGLGRC